MAKGGCDEIVDKNVSELCFGKYRQTELLTCSDTFCFDCLEEYAINLIAMCGVSTELRESGVTNFKWNIYLDREFKADDK